MAGEDIYGSAEHQAFRATVRKFVETELAPRAREFDAMGKPDKAIFRRLGELGLLGIRYDAKYGGQVAAIAVTEPGAGSDVAGIATRAVPDGDQWVINGSKIFITNTANADWLCLLAVTDPAAGYRGYTQIIVPTDTPGFSYRLLDKIGNKGSDTGVLFFDDVRVSVANTIGHPNRGFQQQMSQFQDERMVPVVMGPVSARHLWETTLAHAQQRVVFGKPLARMQVNRFKFVEMMIQITAAQELSHRCIRKLLAGEDVTLDVSMAKVFVANMRQYVATTCVQLFGGAGYMWENPAARAFVDSRLSTIGGGADEVMKEIAAKILKI